MQASHYSYSLKNIAENNQTNKIAVLFTEYCNKGIEPVIAWENAVLESDIYLQENEKKYIILFGIDICTSTAEFVTENSNRNIDEMYKIKEMYDIEKAKKVRLSTTLTVSVGILIIILLI